MNIQPCGQDLPPMLALINAAAEAYRGVIPSDCWQEPYMSLDELRNELACGVTFWGLTIDGAVRGVMGIQPMRDIDLIRHAYVSPQLQRRGIGAALLQHLRHASTRRMLVGTWAAAGWAIDFYRRNDFVLVPADATPGLLRTYWTIPERQIQTSVVLANPPLTALPSSAR